MSSSDYRMGIIHVYYIYCHNISTQEILNIIPVQKNYQKNHKKCIFVLNIWNEIKFESRN